MPEFISPDNEPPLGATPIYDCLSNGSDAGGIGEDPARDATALSQNAQALGDAMLGGPPTPDNLVDDSGSVRGDTGGREVSIGRLFLWKTVESTTNPDDLQASIFGEEILKASATQRAEYLGVTGSMAMATYQSAIGILQSGNPWAAALDTMAEPDTGRPIRGAVGFMSPDARVRVALYGPSRYALQPQPLGEMHFPTGPRVARGDRLLIQSLELTTTLSGHPVWVSTQMIFGHPEQSEEETLEEVGPNTAELLSLCTQVIDPSSLYEAALKGAWTDWERILPASVTELGIPLDDQVIRFGAAMAFNRVFMALQATHSEADEYRAFQSPDYRFP